MSSNTDRVALAFSGGLDTTVCVPLLEEEYGYDEVVGVTVDVGQPEEEFEEAEATATALDLEHHVVDAREAFVEVCLDAVRANATYQGYPLGTALARPVIAKAILDTAVEHDCSAVAHGSTGKGNDQLRFETVWRASELEVIAPVRELGLTRNWEQEYATERDLPVEGGDEGRWSIDTNLWSRSIEGSELEDPSYVPPESIYEWTVPPTGETALLHIEFEEGYPVALTVDESFEAGSQPSADAGETLGPIALIERLNEVAGAYGVGRTDLMEDRMLGLKVRENYEHPAATVLLNAHAALENLVLTKAERSFKEQVDHEWAEMGYKGLVNAPLVEALEGFIEQTNERVTGTVIVKLEGGQARPVGRESEYAVYSAEAASFNTETVGNITQADATGVAKYHGYQERLANTARKQAQAADVEAVTGGDDAGFDATGIIDNAPSTEEEGEE